MNPVRRVVSKAKRVYQDVVFDTAFNSSLARGSAKHVILAYHGIDTQGENLFNKRHTPARYFEKQVAFLKKNYNVINLKDFFQKNFDQQRNTCVLTFDDGYLNNYTNAATILDKYNCKGTFFITGLNKTDMRILWADYVNIAGVLWKGEIVIGGEAFKSINGNLVSEDRELDLLEIVKNHSPELSYKRTLYDSLDKKLTFMQEGKYEEYWKLMNDEQIAQLASNPLFEIRSHGYYHNNLGNIELAHAREELDMSKHYLQNITQKEVTSLGYPDGSYSLPVVEYASSIGLAHQLSIDGFLFDGDAADPYLRNRSGVYNIGSAADQVLEALNRNKNVRN
jgi:peptidoglycan/xylan/chitin deacetylase (PgdA/CDA1 family)